MAITAEQIGTNRYAPSGYDSVRLYGNGDSPDAQGLTLGQLMIAVCMQCASAYESQSVVKMNILTSGATVLDEASAWLEQIANGSADWEAAKVFLTGTLKISADALPANIDTYNNRMAAVGTVKEKVDQLAQQQQRDMIDLQTLVNRRDVAFSTSSNTVKALGNSQVANASNL